MFRRFLNIRPLSCPSSLKSLHHNRPKYNFSEQPPANFDELMKPKSTLPTSLAIGGAAAAVFAYFLYSRKSPKKENVLDDPLEKSSRTQAQPISSEEKKSLSPMQSGLEAALELQNKAKEKFSMGESDAAQEDLELALEVLKNISEGESAHAAAIHFDMGFYNFYSNKIAQAREDFNKAVEIYEKNGLNDKVFDTLFVSALTYEQDQDGGEAYYEKIVKEGQEKLGKSDPNLAEIYIKYGMWHLRNERNKKGLECLGKASYIIKSGQKEAKKEDIGQAYRQLMNGYKQAKAYAQATEAANKVLEYVEIEKEPSLLEDIAILYSEAKDDKKSIEYYQKYLSLLKKLGKSDGEIGKVISETATEYEKQRSDDHALAFWKDFVGLFGGSEDKDIAALSLYGKLRAFALYNRRNKVNEASGELDEAVNRAGEILGDEHMYTKTLKKIRRVYREEKKLEMESLTLILIALEDNLQKLIDTGFINL